MTSPRIPPGLVAYVIGDIHGRADLLIQLLARIEADVAEFPSHRVLKIFLGDYIDRGPASREVIELLIRERGRNCIALLGNHERAMLDFLANPIHDHWLHLGANETLRSYGLTQPLRRMAGGEIYQALHQALPPAHRDFLANLPLAVRLGDLTFVHAGLRPGVPLAEQDREDLIWIRQDFLTASLPAEKLIVHGHTPSSDIREAPGRLGIDTGAFASGKLTAVRFHGPDRAVIQTGAPSN